MSMLIKYADDSILIQVFNEYKDILNFRLITEKRKKIYMSRSKQRWDIGIFSVPFVTECLGRFDWINFVFALKEKVRKADQFLQNKLQ
jgi:hypothetical protein